MPDRTEELLAQLVELQRKQLANQERAIAHQAQSIATQEKAVKRQASAIRLIWVVIPLVVLLYLAIWLLGSLLHSTPR